MKISNPIADQGAEPSGAAMNSIARSRLSGDRDFRIAVVATAYTPNSHAHVITRRWVDPLPTDVEYGWTGARTRLASLHLLQRGPDDQSRPLIEEHGVRDSPDIRDALTLGTGKLAVDAVMLIGEHGDYPFNAFKQKQYPRKEMFDAVMEVIEESGCRIPLYFDKHFSWNPAYAKEMFARIERVGLPFFGGSCTPHCPMLPPPPPLAGCGIRRVAMTCWGDLESYLFHALEVLGSVVERRKGGDYRLAEITAWTGDSAWEAIREGRMPRGLLDAALGVVDPEVRDAVWNRLDNQFEAIELFELTFRDGLTATLVRLHGTIRKWAWACEVEGMENPVAAAPLSGPKELFYPHFARLSRLIEDFFLTETPPISKQRLLFSTLACAACMKALAQPGTPVRENLP